MAEEHKKTFYETIDRWGLPEPIRKLVKKYLKECKTPEEFEDMIWNLTEDLKAIGRFSDNYNKNWHHEECDCDECEKNRYNYGVTTYGGKYDLSSGGD